jgi:hypothetical protein
MNNDDRRKYPSNKNQTKGSYKGENNKKHIKKNINYYNNKKK